MSMRYADDISNDTQLAILRGEFGELKRLVEAQFASQKVRDEESVVDRGELRERIGRLEGRPLIDADDLAEIRQAVRLQLGIHRWLATHKIGVRFAGGFGTALAICGSPILNVIFRRLGWL